MNSIKIGFFDSGIGGIAVMSRARKKLAAADFFYYADTDNVPYGEKTREQIIKYSEEAVKCLLNCGVSVIVIACNTATSMAASYLREKYSIPILGMEPAVKPASENYLGSEILVCATPVTIAGEKLRDLIDKAFSGKESKPDLIALPELVRFAENAIFDPASVCSYLRETIPHPEKYSAVVLGCTHFPYFRDSFKMYFGEDIDLIDGAEGTVNHLCRVVENMEYSNSKEKGNVVYLQSGRTVKDQKTLDFYDLLERKIEYGFREDNFEIMNIIE